MTPKIIAPPAEEPFTIEECRAHLEAQRYDDVDIDTIDDAAILGYLAGAREFCEDFLGLSLSTRILEIALDQYPTSSVGLAIELPMGPVREVISISGEDPITYADSDSTVDPSTYVLDTYNVPNRIKPVAGWPGITAATNAIRIRYLAGYGVDSDGGEELPAVIRSAILLMLAHLFENRADSSDKPVVTISTGTEALLRPRRVRLGMA